MPTRGQRGMRWNRADQDVVDDLRAHRATEEYIAKRDSVPVSLYCGGTPPPKTEEKHMRYLLNSAVLTAPGRYDYRLITPDEARAWAAEPFQSTIGYEQTAEALTQILGRAVPVDRKTIQMAPGDQALVFRLVFPPGTPRIDPADKGRLSQAILDGHYELGLLVRLA